MKILVPNSETQTITIIPREYNYNVDIEVYNENTGEKLFFEDVEADIRNGYMGVSISLDPKNEHHFVLTFKNGSKLIHKTKAYAKAE